jgi:hypothetical protein
MANKNAKNSGINTENQMNTEFMIELKNRINSVGGINQVFKQTKKIKALKTITNYLNGKRVFNGTEDDILQAIQFLENK